MKIACLGECMVELSLTAGGLFSRSFGGDTLNTALYLARLGVDSAFVTALGDDRLSQSMIDAWTAEGIDTSHVLRLSGRAPGLYMIERDAAGERSFLYWRDRAPAREFFARADDATLEALAMVDWLYFSGITLAIYDDSGLEQLYRLLKRRRAEGKKNAFDGNFRPRVWNGDRVRARTVFEQILPLVDLALPTLEDEQDLFGDRDADACAARLRALGVEEIVIKQGAQGCVVHRGDEVVQVAPDRIVAPVDTTAAGDSFNAGYLAARLKGVGLREAALAGHRLAGIVIQHAGAVIPRGAMPARIQMAALDP
jgi:2-dehydro-3-deoxygluconokinase